MDFLKILQGFEETSVPSVLVAGGVLFLFLAVGGRFGVGGEGVSRKISATIGAILLILGLGLYAVPVIVDGHNAQDEESDGTTKLNPTITPSPMYTPVVVIPSEQSAETQISGNCEKDARLPHRQTSYW